MIAQLNGEGQKANGKGQEEQDHLSLAVSPSPVYVILAKIENEQLLILHPAEGKPRILKKEEFMSQWVITAGKGQKANGEREKPLALRL